MRRKRKNLIPASAILATLCFLFLALLVVRNPSLFILLVITVGGIIAAVTIVLPARRHRSLIDKANAIIDQNAEKLARRRAQLVRQDTYGKPVVDKWFAEIDYFISHHIGPSLNVQERALLRHERRRITEMIMLRVSEATRDKPLFEGFAENMTPTEFEAFCAEQLKQRGWDAHTTRQSRDQGVDVIAEKSGQRIVLQCKLYSRPVGNKAVQEAVAARAYEQAHYCAVVSNSSYTSAAEELASTNKVFLLHYSDLRRLEKLLREAGVTD